MISSLKGILTQISPPSMVIDVGGVGYLLQAPMSTIYQLPEIGEQVFLHVHMIVREDAQLLFGFHHQDERKVFELLIKINGVGPKVALAILSNVSIEELIEWVRLESTASFQRIPGVGAKTAQRILLDLKDKIVKLSIESKTQTVLETKPCAYTEAFDALIALGYKSKEAQKAIEPLRRDESLTEPQQIIKMALKGLAKS